MSMITYGYLVDLDRLTSLRGSRDSDLLRSIESKYEGNLDKHRVDLDDTPDRGTVRDALVDILEGRPASRLGGEEYLLALEVLCREIGEPVDLGEAEDCIGRLEDLDIPTGLLSSGPPFPIPVEENRVGFLTAAKVAQEYEGLTARDLGHEEESLELARLAFLLLLKLAFKQNKALVTVTC